MRKYDSDFCGINSFSHRPQLTTLAAFGIAAAVSALSSGINAFIQGRTNKQNRDWQLEDQARLEQREDTALTRRVQDAQNAGLSPLAALQTGAAQSSMVQQAPAQSFQADLSSLSQLAISDAENTKTNETNKEIASGNNNASIEVALTMADAQKQVAKANVQANKEIAANHDQAQKDIAANALAEQQRQFNATLLQKDNEMNMHYIESCRRDKLTLDAMNNDIQKTNFAQWQSIQKANLENIQQWTSDMGLNLKVYEIDCSTEEGMERYKKAYAQAMSERNARMKTYQDYRDAHKDDPEAIASLYSHGKNISGGLNGDVGDRLGKVGAGISGQYSNNETISKSPQAERLQMYQLWDKSERTFYYPVPKGRMSYVKDDLPEWTPKK